MKIKRMLAVVGVAAILAGCGNSPTSDNNQNEGGAPVPGGTLRYVDQAELNSLDPAKVASLGASGGGQSMFAIYDSLLWVNAETGEVEPRIATALEPEGSVNKWRLELRDGVEFSDGTPLDAEAVKFNWERSKDPATEATNVAAASQIDRLDVVDPSTLSITLTEPDRNFDFTVATRLGFIASPTGIKRSAEAFGEEPVGAGPFMLTNWVRDSYKEFERNPNYYDAPRPYLEGLRIDITTDGSQLRSAMLTDQADMVYSLNLVDIEPLEKSGLESVRVLTPGSPNLVFNNSEPPFDDPDARRAIAAAVDLEQMAANTHAFQYLAGPFPDGSPYNFGLEWPKYDPEAAQKLFDEYAERTGGPLKFTISAFNDSTNSAMTTYLQSALNGYDNVEVEVEFSSVTAGVTKVYTAAYQVNTWGSLYVTPDELAFYLETGAQNNVTKYSDPEVDAAFAALAAAEDDALAAKQSEIVVEKLVTDIPFLNLGARASTNIYGSQVHDVTVHDDGVPDFSTIWLSQG